MSLTDARCLRTFLMFPAYRKHIRQFYVQHLKPTDLHEKVNYVVD